MALIENCRALGVLAPDDPAPPGAPRLILRILEGLLFGIQPKAEIAANMGRLPALKALFCSASLRFLDDPGYSPMSVAHISQHLKSSPAGAKYLPTQLAALF